MDFPHKRRFCSRQWAGGMGKGSMCVLKLQGCCQRRKSVMASGQIRETPMIGSRIAAALVLALLPLAASAEEIVVSNYGVTTNGMPYAVAMAKGFFKQHGAD